MQSESFRPKSDSTHGLGYVLGRARHASLATISLTNATARSATGTPCRIQNPCGHPSRSSTSITGFQSSSPAAPSGLPRPSTSASRVASATQWSWRANKKRSVGRACGCSVGGASGGAPQISSSQMSVSIWNISSRARCSAWWMPCGDLSSAAVVCAASAGKDRRRARRVARREMGSRQVRKEVRRETRVAKFEFLRKGWSEGGNE